MTAQESMRVYELEKAKKENGRKYHTEEIRQFSGQTVATSENWEYVLQIFKDNSACLLYVKKDSQHESGFFCGVDRLRSRMKERIAFGWNILEPEFFDILEIA